MVSFTVVVGVVVVVALVAAVFIFFDHVVSLHGGFFLLPIRTIVDGAEQRVDESRCFVAEEGLKTKGSFVIKKLERHYCFRVVRANSELFCSPPALARSSSSDRP